MPYISHLLAVGSLTLGDDGSEDEAIAALLHDAVEDQGAYLLGEIQQRFGQGVADIVAGCSDVLDTNGGAKPPWQLRKQAYLAHLGFSVDARNAEAHLWYLTSRAEVFHRRRGEALLVRELEAAVETLRALARAS